MVKPLKSDSTAVVPPIKSFQINNENKESEITPDPLEYKSMPNMSSITPEKEMNESAAGIAMDSDRSDYFEIILICLVIAMITKVITKSVLSKVYSKLI